MRRTHSIALATAAVLLLGFLVLARLSCGPDGCGAVPPAVASFEECVAAGNPVMESYPRQCRTPQGQTFTEQLASSASSEFSSAVSAASVSSAGGSPRSSASGSSASAVAMREVKLFFGSRTAPAGRECEALAVVERDVPADDPLRGALEALLKGPMGNSDAITGIAAGTILNRLTIDGGVAKADFNAQLQNYGGGSCTVSLIREQIERTLLQFTEVRRVEITVEGRADDVLQP